MHVVLFEKCRNSKAQGRTRQALHPVTNGQSEVWPKIKFFDLRALFEQLFKIVNPHGSNELQSWGKVEFTAFGHGSIGNFVSDDIKSTGLIQSKKSTQGPNGQIDLSELHGICLTGYWCFASLRLALEARTENMWSPPCSDQQAFYFRKPATATAHALQTLDTHCAS